MSLCPCGYSLLAVATDEQYKGMKTRMSFVSFGILRDEGTFCLARYVELKIALVHRDGASDAARCGKRSHRGRQSGESR